MKFSRHLSGITNLDRKGIDPLGTNWMCTTMFEKYKSINTYRELTKTGYPSRHKGGKI
jgi:hypothetical protein